MKTEYDATYRDAPHPNPAETTEHGDSSERHPAYSASVTANAAGKRRILVVDDDNSVRETLADLLEISGYCPLQAADAPEALTILRQEPVVHVLITDLTMPGADGIALIRRARELRHDLPAILLTGYADEITTVAARAGVHFHILGKPVSSARLLEQLEHLVAQSSDA
ncbi:MAG: response regulator [Rhodopila sp.]|jgi:CheY-like chemotaxis protein